MNKKLEEFIGELANLMKKYNAEISETGTWEAEGLTIEILNDKGEWHSIDIINSNLNCDILHNLINK